MSYSRGSSLLELLIASALLSGVLLAAVHADPRRILAPVRNAWADALTARVIQDELALATRNCQAGISYPQVKANIDDIWGPFSNTTKPLPHSAALVSASVASVPTVTERVDRSRSSTTLIHSTRFFSAQPRAVLGCAPDRCMELLCQNGECRLAANSQLWKPSAELMPFIAILYPINDIAVLYLSARGSLRRLSILDGAIRENQPISDGLSGFDPEVLTLPALAGGCIVRTSIRLARRPERSIVIEAFQQFISPIIPIAFLSFPAV